MRPDLTELAEHWNDLADDAKWAVLSAPERRNHGWDEAGFWKTGQDDVAHVLAQCSSVGATPARDRVLDFGCGVGRLSAALAKEFGRVDGVDVSSKMIAAARATQLANATFHENRSGDLSLFPSESFDFVLSLIVLQHVPPPHNLRYVSEFARVLRRGGVACFQFPTRPRRRLSRKRLRTHLRRALFRLPGAKGLWRAVRGELPIEMYGLSEQAVTSALQRGGVELIQRAADEAAGEDWYSVRYICRKT